MTVKYFNIGLTNSELFNGTGALGTYIPTTVDTGSNAVTFQVVGFLPGTYDITVVSAHTLMNVKKNVNVAVLEATAVNFGSLLEGNCNGDSIINTLDFSILAASYLKLPGAGFDARADFDINGAVNTLDFSLLAANYLKSSPQVIP